ncbi:MAG: PQQ-binding-like beta-propeller repeat protein, partial [Ktedonobacterales bacterium]|nr:PQQ-binding-like beta-propeller repeat protein [Ktedonobacterales bacterium]
KDPTQRYPSVAAFVKALQGVFGATSAGGSLPLPFSAESRFASTSASGLSPLGLSGASEASPNRVTLSGIPVVAVQSSAPLGVVNDEPRNPLPRRPNPVGKWLMELPRPLSIGGGIGVLLVVVLIGLLVSHATMKPPRSARPLFTVNYQRPIQGAPNARPVINGNVIYEAAHDGTLYALDSASGREVWHFTTGGTLVAGVAIDAKGTLYLPAGDGNLYALNPDGTLKWKYALGSAAVTTPVVVDTIVGVGSADGHYSGIGIDKGNRVWQVSATATFANESAVNEKTLYIGNANHQFYALDMTNGKTLWTFVADGAIKGGAIYKDKTVIFGTETATLFCLKGERGQIIWKNANVGAIGTQPIVNGGSVYIAAKDGTLHSFDATTGGLIWQKSLDGPVSNDALLVNNTIITVADDGTLTLIDPTTPAIVGKQQLGQTLSAPLALSDNIIYISGNGYFERLTLTKAA